VAAGRLASSSERVPAKDVMVFTRQLSIMVRTAVPLLEALGCLTRQQKHPAFRSMLQEITKDVQHGHPLSGSCARFPGAFGDVFVSLLAAGEASGTMDTMLDRITAYLAFQEDLRAKIRSALLYPSIVFLTSTGVVAFLVLFVLPTFMQIFSQFDTPLPLPTRILLAVSDHIRSWWYLYAGGAAAVGAYLRRWFTDPARLGVVHEFELSLPVVGPLVRTLVLTRVLKTLAALVSSGVPILQSLSLARAAAGHEVFHDLMDKVYRNAAQGKGLSLAFSQSRHVPPQVADMIGNSGKTGTLPAVLEQISAHFESETDTEIRNLFSVLEPLCVIVLGVLVGAIAVAILLPVFELDRGLL
jgi:type IV pilus assembly protein PilC